MRLSLASISRHRRALKLGHPTALLARVSVASLAEPTKKPMDHKPFSPPAAATGRNALDAYFKQLLESHWQHGFGKGYLLVRPPPDL